MANSTDNRGEDDEEVAVVRSTLEEIEGKEAPKPAQANFVHKPGPAVQFCPFPVRVYFMVLSVCLSGNAAATICLL